LQIVDARPGFVRGVVARFSSTSSRTWFELGAEEDDVLKNIRAVVEAKLTFGSPFEEYGFIHTGDDEGIFMLVERKSPAARIAFAQCPWAASSSPRGRW